MRTHSTRQRFNQNWYLVCALYINDKAATLLPSASKNYVVSAFTLFIYVSSLLKRFGSCTIRFPASVGIFAFIRNLIFSGPQSKEQTYDWSIGNAISIQQLVQLLLPTRNVQYSANEFARSLGHVDKE
jgi:hypothetical protein